MMLLSHRILFKSYHDGLVEEVLGRMDVGRGAYMPLYLFALLDVRLRTGVEMRMLKEIGLSLKNIDRYS